MASGVFSALFDRLTMPVLAVRKNNPLSVVYCNEAAKQYFLPVSRREQAPPGDGANAREEPLERILRFQNLDASGYFTSSLLCDGAVDGLPVTVLSFLGDPKSVRAYAAEARIENSGYYVIYLAPKDPGSASETSRRSQDIFRTVVDNLEELVYITDLDTYELKFVSKSLANSLGRDNAEIIGRRCWETLHCGPQDGPCPFCPLPRLLAREKGDNASHVWELHNKVNGKWYLMKNNIVDWIDGRPVHLGAMVDISYRKQYEEQLKRFAATDAMTDVYNRKWGYDKLNEQFSSPLEVRRNQTLCFLDMDGLKRVNDTFGHAAGDEMIINTIQTIFSCVRKDDYIIRWGGDEFVVFLNCNLENAEKVMGKIAFGFEHFNSTRNRPYRISVSAGLVNFAEHFGTLDELIDEADRRMYANKVAKRNRTGIFLR